MKPIELTDENFDDIVLTSDKPVLVDFTAEWCGPCKVMGPVVELLTDELKGVAVVGKLDVDTNPAITAKYSVRNMPSFLIFKEGELVDRVIGAVSRKVLEQKVMSVTA